MAKPCTEEDTPANAEIATCQENIKYLRAYIVATMMIAAILLVFINVSIYRSGTISPATFLCSIAVVSLSITSNHLCLHYQGERKRLEDLTS